MKQELTENYLKRMKNLPQFRGKTDEEVKSILEGKQVKLVEQKASFKEKSLEEEIETLFSDKEEVKAGKELLRKYLHQFSLDNISDKNLLIQLIYLEIFQYYRLQKAAEDFQTTNKAVPLQILDSIHKNLDKIVELKEKLGLTRSALKGDDPTKIIELYKKKFKIHRETIDQASKTLSCPHCGQMICLKIRTKFWEAMKHPFFVDRILGNKHIVKLYQEGRLTKEDVGLIFGTSTDYVEWLILKWGMNKKQEKETLGVSVVSQQTVAN